MIIYAQKTGIITRNYLVLGVGYSGHGEGVNNPALEAVPRTGPIPRGIWRMIGVKNSPNTGPYTIILIPVDVAIKHRSAFRVHGDNKFNNHTASQGCIISAPGVRRRMYDVNKPPIGDDALITVVGK